MSRINAVTQNTYHANLQRPVIVPARPPKVDHATLKTGLCYDVRCRYHAKIPASLFEYVDPHPEDPRRTYRIYKMLAEYGLIEDSSLSGKEELGNMVVKIPIREASTEEILDVHSEEHLSFVRDSTKLSEEELKTLTEKGDSIYLNNDSYYSARLSCGGAIEACSAVVEGRVKNALAVVRPPGHHAEPDLPGGFCLFSNVSVAAKSILKRYTESVRRILILDWDIHHGNGTQKAFYNDPRVLYISLHRFEMGKFYPGTPAGQMSQVGEGAGEGFNCNITWSLGGVGDAEYILAFEKVVMPMAREFRPDLVIVSSGFDAADGDRIGQCHVTPQCYSQMTYMLNSLARGNLCVVLEGGYNLNSISVSALSVAKVLIGEPPEPLPKPNQPPNIEVLASIEKVIRIQAKYWRCFRSNYGNLGPGSLNDSENELIPNLFPLQTIVREMQLQLLYDKYEFIPLNITDSKLSANSVIASPNYFNSESLYIIIHDPPEFWGNRDMITGLFDPSTSILIDSTEKCIDWIISRNSNVIDIEIPVCNPNNNNYDYINEAHNTILSLWDNHIIYMPNLQKISFIGLGMAATGILNLISKRDVKDLVKSVTNCMGNYSLESLAAETEESTVDWFYKNSLIFTSPDNACWKGNNETRPAKKFGRVLKSDSDDIYKIVEERFDEMKDFILDAFEEWSDEDEDEDEEQDEEETEKEDAKEETAEDQIQDDTSNGNEGNDNNDNNEKI